MFNYSFKSEMTSKTKQIISCLFNEVNFLLQKHWNQLLTTVSFWSWGVASSLISLLCFHVIPHVCVLHLIRWRYWIIVYQYLLSHVLFIEKLFCCLRSSCYLLTSHEITLTGCCVYSDGLPINKSARTLSSRIIISHYVRMHVMLLAQSCIIKRFLLKPCFTYFCCVPF